MVSYNPMRLVDRLINVLYPPACLLCQRRTGEQSPIFCEACERSVQRVLPPCCQRCGVGLAGAYDAKLLCQRCRERPLAFEKACSPFVFAGAVREAIHAFKYYGRRRIGLWLAKAMAQAAMEELPVSEIKAVVPVPMHWAKARFKGANPAAHLGQAVANMLNIPCHPECLRRVRWTPTQTRLSPRQRFRNVQGAFALHRMRTDAQDVLLVDDVLTSGATAHECARALRQGCVKTVFVLTAACAAST